MPPVIHWSALCKLARDYSDFFLSWEQELRSSDAFLPLSGESREIREAIEYCRRMNSICEVNYQMLRERANFQVGLLFNVINQQDSALNRWDSRLNHLIAWSTKQDGIATTTFTFVTALFLLGRLSPLFSV